MGLAENIEKEFTATKSGACAFSRLAASLPAEDQQVLERAVRRVRDYRNAKPGEWRDSQALTAAAIRRALAAEGHSLAKDVVEKHVYGSCGCDN